jgi:hypothetical protein
MRPNGFWKLYVFDDEEVSRGQFDGGWTIQITARVKR